MNSQKNSPDGDLDRLGSLEDLRHVLAEEFGRDVAYAELVGVAGQARMQLASASKQLRHWAKGNQSPLLGWPKIVAAFSLLLM